MCIGNVEDSWRLKVNITFRRENDSDHAFEKKLNCRFLWRNIIWLHFLSGFFFVSLAYAFLLFKSLEIELIVTYQINIHLLLWVIIWTFVVVIQAQGSMMKEH